MKRVTSSACRMWARVLSPLDCWIICISVRQKNAEQLSEHLNWNSYTVKIRVLRCLRACGCMQDISISVLDLFHLIGMVFICFQTFIIRVERLTKGQLYRNIDRRANIYYDNAMFGLKKSYLYKIYLFIEG